MHTNRLINENSPYLLQHAHNPVDWYPWGDEAFQKAKSENKPIIVSIGYSTCHWCHVMERESFENEDIAAFMNKYFVNIKVDREERPDVDSIYMEAVQMVTGGHGGWPLNCFLLPDARPFFGGTYFPPKQAHGRVSWEMVLKNIQQAFEKRPQEILTQADKLMEYIHQSDAYFVNVLDDIDTTQQQFDFSQVKNAYNVLSESFDETSGGFGHAPKFPGTMALRFCLNYYYFEKHGPTMEHLQHSLDAMIYGGIYDQLGGGFSRYAVDREWLVPHFEKMLYDNALLVGLLADSYKLTQKTLYKETIEETLTWVEREMLSEEGGFYAALDADSEGVEGKFYVWSKQEVDEALGSDAALFSAFYDVTEHGNWGETNILHRPQSFAGFAKDQGLVEEDLKSRLKTMRQKLWKVRTGRIRPGLDDKILLSWNAMMCSAYCKAYQALGNEHYKEMAIRNMEFLLDKFSKSTYTLFHNYKEGQAKNDAFLDDYALLVEALIELYQITFNTKWLQKAEGYTEQVLENFLDPADQLFFFTTASQTDIIVRKKDLYDNAVPSGVSTMIHNLQKLATLLDKSGYREQAQLTLLNMKDAIQKYPQSFGRWSNALFTEVYPHKEIAIVGAAFKEKALVLQSKFMPNALYCAAGRPDPILPLLAGRETGSKTLIFVCSNYTCQLPSESIEDALIQLAD